MTVIVFLEGFADRGAYMNHCKHARRIDLSLLSCKTVIGFAFAQGNGYKFPIEVNPGPPCELRVELPASEILEF